MKTINILVEFTSELFFCSMLILFIIICTNSKHISFSFIIVATGTPEERGINWGTEENQTTEDSPCYNLPFGMAWINGVPFLRRLPFSPTFTGFKKISSVPCRRQAPSRI